MEEVPSQRMQQVISCPRNPIWASRVVEWKQAHASRPCSVVSGSGNGARTSKPGGFLRRCCRRPGSLQLLAIMSLSLAGISRGCHRRRSPSPSFKRHGLNLDPRLADCRQTTKDPFAIFAELEMDGAWSFHSMASRKATQSPFAVPAMRQSVSAPKPGCKSRLNVMRISKDACRGM